MIFRKSFLSLFLQRILRAIRLIKEYRPGTVKKFFVMARTRAAAAAAPAPKKGARKATKKPAAKKTSTGKAAGGKSKGSSGAN